MIKKFLIISLLCWFALPINAFAENSGNTGRLQLHINSSAESSEPVIKANTISGSFAQQIEEKGFATAYIGFAFNSATILSDYQDVIQGINQLLVEQQDWCLLLTGHTDSNGDADYNKDLSLKRALAIKNALIELGIADSRLAVEGQGAASPIADNSTKEGRELNRRVELHKQACGK